MPQPRRSCQQCDQRVSCGGPAENLRSNRDRSGGLCRISGSRAAERHGAKPSISLRTANSPCCSTGRAMCCWRAARSRALSAVGACSRSPPCSALSCSGCSWLRAAACLAEREPGCRLVPDAGGRRLNGAATARAAGHGAGGCCSRRSRNTGTSRVHGSFAASAAAAGRSARAERRRLPLAGGVRHVPAGDRPGENEVVARLRCQSLTHGCHGRSKPV